MSDLARSAGPGLTSLADLEPRLALAGSGGRLSLQDQLDWGEAFLRRGDAEEARLLVQAALIQQGLAPRLAATRRPLLARTGVPEDARSPVAEPAPQANTVDLAIAELRALARTLAPALAERLANQPPRQRSAAGLHPTAVQRRAATRPSDVPVAQAVADVFGWLCAPSPDGSERERAVIAMEVLRGIDNDPRRFSAAPLVGSPPDVLAPALAVQELRFFLRQSADILLEPLGSPGLFHALAALDTAGLGPYFGNVGQIIRRSANLFELARIAERESEAAGAFVGEKVWAVLLGRRLEGALLAELVDDLGDDNAGSALHLLLDRVLAVAREDVDQPIIMRIRDAALDNLDYDLAARAQRALVKLRPGNMLELRILGTIDASAGLVAAADQSLGTCLAHNPDDVDLRRQIEANQRRQFAPFALVKGFGSPHDRQLRRLRMRGSGR